MTPPRSSADDRPIAIVGIGCRFPGGVTDPESFWRLLSHGADAITEVPPDRIDLASYFDARPAIPGRMMTRWGGFLERIDELDAGFFSISPREAERIDPQQRLILETAWEALEDAGQDVHRLEGSTAGVFVGQWLSDFEGRLFADPEAVDFHMTVGSGRYAVSGRVSYALGLRGPSVTLDTACSSSLVAVHLGVRAIRNGESELVLAGGVNTILLPHITIAYSQSRMMAPDGRCKFGDAAANGYVRSEGAGIVVLKALDRALAEGDRIYAVIRGSAINNDGRSSGSMGTPSRIGQEELLRSAYRDARVAPGRVQYIEAHGTGTSRGDPVELGALGAVLSEDRAPGHRAFVGSVKTNIGHTEGAAGVAGLIKTALALHHGTIPASLHCRELNPAIAWADLPLELVRAEKPWPKGDGARVAGVSAFGIAGTNAHVVLEESPRAQNERASSGASLRAGRRDRGELQGQSPSNQESERGRAMALLPLTARSHEALKSLALRYADRLEGTGAQDGGPDLRDVCWSAATRRTHLEVRAMFAGTDRGALVKGLRQYAEGAPATAEGIVSGDARPKIVFVVPGQGAQWVGMARELLAKEPAFRAAIEQCEEASQRWVDWSITEQLRLDPGSSDYGLDRIDVIQPVLVAIAIAYAALWRSLGVEPDAVVGHSMGEVGAAFLSGVLTLDQAMQIICRRSALMRRASGKGRMALVDLSMEAVEARIGKRSGRLGVAVSNSPRSSVIAGDAEAVTEMLAELGRDGVFCRLVKVDVASHSPHMEPLAKELAIELAGLTPRPAKIPMYSTVLAASVEGKELGADYWGSNLRQPVLFGETVRALLEDVPCPVIFVELGPHPLLLSSIEQTAKAGERAVVTIASGRRDDPEQARMLSALGGLWAMGYPIDWSKVMPDGGRHVSLPLYPWQRERHWASAAEIGRAGQPSCHQERPDDESLGWLHEPAWKASEPSAASAANASSMTSSWLVLSDDPSSRGAFAGALTEAGARAETASLERLEAVLDDTGLETDALLVVANQTDAAYLPIRVLKAVLRSRRPKPPRLWFVTSGAVSTSKEPARVSVEQAALWGTARVIAEEHPELWGGLVDLDPARARAENASLLARHLVHGGEDQVALRDGTRLGLRLSKVKAESAPPFVFRSDAAYLVTGGLGDLGLHVARAMADRGARRLVLLGRTPLPPREQWKSTPATSPSGQRIAAVRSLEAQGVAVHTVAVDVGDEAQLRAFLDRWTMEGWPPIKGVVHAAAALDNKLAAETDRATFDAVLRAKLRGAQLLDRLLPDLDLFVTFSSIVALIGQSGEANYAAANAGLDALAYDRRARGLPALSIDWCVWSNTGFAKGEVGSYVEAELGRQGIRAVSPERGAALFDWLCADKRCNVAVLPIDWSAFHRARMGRGLSLYRDLLARGGSGAPEPELCKRLEAASASEKRQLVEAVVRESVAKVLKITPSRIDPRRALGSVGLNSLLAMELRNQLEAALGRSLSATLAWNYPTVTALVDYLAGSGAASGDVARPASSAASTIASVATVAMTEHLPQVSQLSDEEAATALRKGRARGAS